ncbi:hypothetical protein J6590_101845 [Homalodisca vitripennis]|nr:hypothetical protein J6590_101845 [Homalodisca vitripennis]
MALVLDYVRYYKTVSLYEVSRRLYQTDRKESEMQAAEIGYSSPVCKDRKESIRKKSNEIIMDLDVLGTRKGGHLRNSATVCPTDALTRFDTSGWDHPYEGHVCRVPPSHIPTVAFLLLVNRPVYVVMEMVLITSTTSLHGYGRCQPPTFCGHPSYLCLSLSSDSAEMFSNRGLKLIGQIDDLLRAASADARVPFAVNLMFCHRYGFWVCTDPSSPSLFIMLQRTLEDARACLLNGWNNGLLEKNVAFNVQADQRNIEVAWFGESCVRGIRRECDWSLWESWRREVKDHLVVQRSQSRSRC